MLLASRMDLMLSGLLENPKAYAFQETNLFLFLGKDRTLTSSGHCRRNSATDIGREEATARATLIFSIR